MLGLPDRITACLFDLDGVLTKTASVHDAAWKATFDAFLREQAEQRGEPFVPFNSEGDYLAFVDGKPRLDGIRGFLASRGIELADGDPADPPGTRTINGLGNDKTQLFDEELDRHGVEVYPGSLRFVQAARAHGMPCAVVSASKHCRHVLAAAGIENLFDARIDGLTAEAENLAGKPAPDMFLAAARAIEREPQECAVFEDALAGVAAARAGGFGWVVGVNRGDRDHAEQLRSYGADDVVNDLAELLDSSRADAVSDPIAGKP